MRPCFVLALILAGSQGAHCARGHIRGPNPRQAIAAEKPPVDTNQESIGRFRISRPTVLAVAYRMQSIYGVDVWVATEKQTPWLQRLVALGPNIESRSSLGSGIEAVWYKVGEDLLIDAQKGKIWAHRGAPEGKEAGAEELVRDVILSYREGASNGFSIGPGAIVIEKSLSETALLQMSNETVEVEFSTQTVREPNTRKFMDVGEERDFAALAGGSLTVLRERERKIAGLKGRELHVRVTTPKTGEHTRYTWHFPGEPRSASRPSVTLLAKTASAAAALEPIWESLLTSIQCSPSER